MTDSMDIGWHYAKRGAGRGHTGPLAWTQLHALCSSGSLAASDLVWHPTLPRWISVAEVPGLLAAPACGAVQPREGPQGRPGAVRSALAMILNPGQVLKGALEGVPWPLCVGISGLAFALFFLQTALDLHRQGALGNTGIVALSAVGFGLGSIGVAVIATLAWVIARPLGGRHPLEWAIRAFCLSYVPTLVFVIVGLIFSLAADWRTALCFGITGALWAVHPMLSVCKELTRHGLVASLVLVTVCGGLIICAWAYLVEWGWKLGT